MRKFDRRVGCSPDQFSERVPEEFLNVHGTVVNTPAVNDAIRPDLPEFGSINDLAQDLGISRGTATTLVRQGSFEVCQLDLAKPRFKYNVASLNFVLDQRKIEKSEAAAQRLESGETGWLLRGGPTLVNSASLIR